MWVKGVVKNYQDLVSRHSFTRHMLISVHYLCQSPTHSHSSVHTAGGYGGGELGKAPLTQGREQEVSQLIAVAVAEEGDLSQGGRNIHLFYSFPFSHTHSSPLCPAAEIHLLIFLLAPCGVERMRYAKHPPLPSRTKNIWYLACKYFGLWNMK